MIHLIPVLHLMTDALRRRLGSAGTPAPDPLDHPALRRMSLRELADLPVPRPEGPGSEDLRPAAWAGPRREHDVGRAVPWETEKESASDHC